MADIPGIIEGAHRGKGLGDRFLQHVERTRALAYLVPLDSEDPQATYDLLRHEAAAYDAGLAAKPHIVVFTKSDLVPADDPLPDLRHPDAVDVLAISAVARRGLEELKERLWQMVTEIKSRDAEVDAQLR
jgi:GTP-binding protein